MSDSTAKDNKVVIYSTNWCAFCKTEKQWLDSLNVDYIEKNIETDKAAEQELLQKLNGNFQGVPVTDIAGDVILGFDRPKLQAALEKNKLVTV